MQASGVSNPAEAVASLALEPTKVRHYVEFHIEQGPQLEAAAVPLGVVSGIAGQTWLSVSVEGEQNHGGGSVEGRRRGETKKKETWQHEAPSDVCCVNLSDRSVGSAAGTVHCSARLPASP